MMPRLRARAHATVDGQWRDERRPARTRRRSRRAATAPARWASAPPCSIVRAMASAAPTPRPASPHLRVAAVAVHARGLGGVRLAHRACTTRRRCSSRAARHDRGRRRSCSCSACSSAGRGACRNGCRARYCGSSASCWSFRSPAAFVSAHDRRRAARASDSACCIGTSHAVRAVDRRRRPSCASATRSRASRRSRSSSSAASSSAASRMRACAAAGAGRAAFPVQHAGQRAGAGGLRFAAGLEGAHEPHRLSTRGRAAHALAVDHARRRSGAGARLSRAHADAHAGPPAVRDPSRSRRRRDCTVRP